MGEIIFEVLEDEADGGYTANALGYGIQTQGETLEELRAMVKDAVNCYFDETMQRPEGHPFALEFTDPENPLRQNQSWCALLGFFERSLLPVGRIDLAVEAPGYNDSGFALGDCGLTRPQAHLDFNPSCPGG